MLNMFRTLIHLSSGACDFSIVSPHWLCVFVSMCVGVSVWLVGVVSVWRVYQLTCNICNLLYVGQTSRSLKIRFQEQIRYIRYNNPQSAEALHILQNQHEYGQINSTMTLLKPLNNPSLLLPYERYCIQSLHQEGKRIPEQSPGETNPLFQRSLKPNPHIPHEQISSASACIQIPHHHNQTTT